MQTQIGRNTDEGVLLDIYIESQTRLSQGD